MYQFTLLHNVDINNTHWYTVVCTFIQESMYVILIDLAFFSENHEIYSIKHLICYNFINPKIIL